MMQLDRCMIYIIAAVRHKRLKVLLRGIQYVQLDYIDYTCRTAEWDVSPRTHGAREGYPPI
jgi:hypothetical protein